MLVICVNRWLDMAVVWPDRAAAKTIEKNIIWLTVTDCRYVYTKKFQRKSLETEESSRPNRSSRVEQYDFEPIVGTFLNKILQILNIERKTRNSISQRNTK
ncbi:hypothetical protein PoB_001057900 [Plakobranchus ocellatus]|uniref:Uncharacterized protein n=1 Tax=Plakobranchus ocellatus TaxID=259542 RepID=A0AAV3YM28_9GAST|nr:hypothetical protein PoB_001057900 [Plakobranchus ocellatus]